MSITRFFPASCLAALCLAGAVGAASAQSGGGSSSGGSSGGSGGSSAGASGGAGGSSLSTPSYSATTPRGTAASGGAPGAAAGGEGGRAAGSDINAERRYPEDGGRAIRCPDGSIGKTDAGGCLGGTR